MYGFLFAFFIVGPLLGTLLYWLFSGVTAVASDPEPLPYGERPAGRIHLFDGNRYYSSSAENPYEHRALNWADGHIGCAMSHDLMEHPEYQPALIGTIQVLKPEHEKGLVAVILDNRKVAALGLAQVGLNSGAQMLVDRMIPRPSLNHS